VLPDLLVFNVQPKSEQKDQNRMERDSQLIAASNLALLNAIPDVMLLLSVDGVVLHGRNAERNNFQLSDAQLIGKNVYEFMPAQIAQNYLQYIRQTSISRAGQLYEYQLPCNGRVCWYEARIFPSGKNDVLFIIRDITERKQMQEQLEFLSLRDAVTGLYNRTCFENEMTKLNIKSNVLTGIVVCDVDGLKLINDTLGHRAGDLVLKTVAEILNACFRSTDVIARIGGDEFAVIIVESDLDFVEQAGERIRVAIIEHNEANPSLPVSLSIGWAIRARECTADDLLKEADHMMYRQKLHQSQSTKSAMVQALVGAMEARDYGTEGHCDRLQGLVIDLARKINVHDHVFADLRLLARFHDIGKVGLPDAVLFKPGPLSAEEYIMMQKHCEIGYRIAKSTPDLAPIAQWILKHHEWWNGRGYPLGLKGTDIPIECRILAVADAYDAMTHDRPYRKAIGYQEALAELKRCEGEQFDPALVDPFIEMIVQHTDPII
jgi:diguanylate cyclase (GGDEF)-like protein/PAS domain S-box-containing protein